MSACLSSNSEYYQHLIKMGLVHSMVYLRNHSLTNSLTQDSLIQALTQSLTTHSILIYCITHSIAHSFTHPLFRSLTQCLRLSTDDEV